MKIWKILLGIILILVILDCLTYEKKVVGKTDCYDEKNNKIYGLECEETEEYVLGIKIQIAMPIMVIILLGFMATTIMDL